MAITRKDVLPLYQRRAGDWERLRGMGLIEAGWLGAFRECLPDAARVLDLGCATGRPIAGWLIAAGCRITGVDGAPAMIERARTSFPDHDWRVADMRALPDLGTFDGLVAWHSFFHLAPDDQPAVLARFGTLVRPGGALMFTSGTERGEAIGDLGGEALYHGSLDTADYAARLAAAGFEVLRHVVSDPGCGGATVWLARRLDNP